MLASMCGCDDRLLAFQSGMLCLRACVDVMIGYWLFNQGCCAYMYMSRMKVDEVFTCVRDRERDE